MSSPRKANNLISRLHERSIRLVSADNKSNFENLFEKKIKINDNSPKKFESIYLQVASL